MIGAIILLLPPYKHRDGCLPVKKADVVDGLDSLEDLVAQSEGGGEGEGSPGLGPPQLGQVLALELHHHVVEAVVAAAPDEPADVVAALKLFEHSHFHLQHLSKQKVEAFKDGPKPHKKS